MAARGSEQIPGLRDQFEVVVGSLENILSELRGVAADLKVVVNQIDDVTNQIEASHSKSRYRHSQGDLPASSSIETTEKFETNFHKPRASMDSGIQDVMSLHDYVNVDKLGLDLMTIRQKVRRHFKENDKQTNLSENKKNTHMKQNVKASLQSDHVSEAENCCDKHTATCGINSMSPSDLMGSKHSPGGTMTSREDVFTRIVKKKKRCESHCGPSNSSISIRSGIVRDKSYGTLHKSTTAPCVSSFGKGFKPDSVSDVYERRFEEQLEQLNLYDSDPVFNNHFYTRRGWSSSSAISDPVDFSDHLLEMAYADEDTAYESDDNCSEYSTNSHIRGIKPSDSFRYKLRQQLGFRQNSTSPSWRVVIAP